MGIRGASARYNDRVELFVDTTTIDKYGKPVNVRASIGVVSASIEWLAGSRFAYFQSLGYSRPVVVRLWARKERFDAMVWNGLEIQVKDLAVDKENRNKTIVTGDVVNEHF